MNAFRTNDPWYSAFKEGRELARRFPARPTACWTVSAGHDMRPLVYFSDPYLAQVVLNAGITLNELPKPELFVHTSLGIGGGLHDLYPGLVTYQDNGTRIQVDGYWPLHLDRDRIAYEINPRWVYFAEDPLINHDHDAAMLTMKVDCLHTG